MQSNFTTRKEKDDRLREDSCRKNNPKMVCRWGDLNLMLFDSTFYESWPFFWNCLILVRNFTFIIRNVIIQWFQNFDFFENLNLSWMKKMLKINAITMGFNATCNIQNFVFNTAQNKQKLQSPCEIQIKWFAYQICDVRSKNADDVRANGSNRQTRLS